MNTKTATRDQATERTAEQKQEVAVFQPPRLPFHQAIEQRFEVSKSNWKVLVESIFPAAKSVDAVVMALAYCQKRKLDVFKRVVHIVPMWNSALGHEVETVWPAIAELRTTAFRTGQYAGMDAAEFGPELEQELSGTKGSNSRNVTVRFPEWCRITVYRVLHGQTIKFVGPKVYWLESYGRWRGTDAPNEMWAKRSVGQLEKCAEAAALRRAFPEELGNELSAEEMEGRVIEGEAREILPKRESRDTTIAGRLDRLASTEAERAPAADVDATPRSSQTTGRDAETKEPEGSQSESGAAATDPEVLTVLLKEFDDALKEIKNEPDVNDAWDKFNPRLVRLAQPEKDRAVAIFETHVKRIRQAANGG